MNVKERLRPMRKWGANALFLIVGFGIGTMLMLAEKNKEQERGDMYYDKCQQLSRDIEEKDKTITELNASIVDLQNRLSYYSAARQRQLDNIAWQQQQIQSELQRQRTRDFFEGRFPY